MQQTIFVTHKSKKSYQDFLSLFQAINILLGKCSLSNMEINIRLGEMTENHSNPWTCLEIEWGIQSRMKSPLSCFFDSTKDKALTQPEHASD